MAKLDKINIGDSLSDDQAMVLALWEAWKGAGFVSPNPPVGCVILDSQGYLLSKGHHEFYGGPHAEINALKGLSPSQLHGARLFATLEPCSHEGKTPSCAKALSHLPLKEVIYGLEDPNPLVSGMGAQILAKAGIKVTLFDKRKQELEEVCEHFLMNFRNHKPFVSLKVASSLDGQMALTNGKSQWITQEPARELGRYLRAIHDITVVGKKTLLQDNPRLDIRLTLFPNKRNKILILDSLGECLERTHLEIFKHHPPEDIFVAVSEARYRHSPLCQLPSSQILVIPDLSPDFSSKNMLNLNYLLNKLWSIGIKSVFVEGGGQTLSEFIAQKEAHRLYLFQAPILIGARHGLSWSCGVSINQLADRVYLRDTWTEGPLHGEWPARSGMTDRMSDFLISGRFQ